MTRFSMAVSGTLAFTLFIATGHSRAPGAAGAKPPQSNEKFESLLSHTIRHQVQQLPYYSVFDYITFSLDGEKVTLRGQVLRPTLKAHAEAALKSMEGVASVVNNIEVLPASPHDDELRRNIYRAIYEDAVLQKYAVQALPPIHIIVKNSMVSLEGAVGSDADKALAASRANKVPDLTSFRNNLFVHKKDSPEK